MAKTSISIRNRNKPAPITYRKFENAYFTALAPALSGLIMGWGFSDPLTTKLSLVLVLFGGVVKGFGIMLANGQVYSVASKEGDDTDNGGGAVTPTKGF